jgi:hypothetical protein
LRDARAKGLHTPCFRLVGLVVIITITVNEGWADIRIASLFRKLTQWVHSHEGINFNMGFVITKPNPFIIPAFLSTP